MSSSLDGSFVFWDVGKRVKCREVKGGHGAGIQYFQFADDYRYVCTVCCERVNVWRCWGNVEQGENSFLQSAIMTDNNSPKVKTFFLTFNRKGGMVKT